MVADRSFAPQKQGSRLGSWLVGLAVLGAFGVTLYRNDVLREVAKSAGQERSYLALERSLGSPGFGTPRAVEHLAALTPKLTADLNTPAPVLTTVERAQTPAPVETSAPAPAETAAPSSESASSSSSTASSGSKSTSLESLVAAQMGGERKKASSRERAREREAPARPARRAGRDQSEPALGIKGSSNRFDPLNGKL